jgi:undecaprenyl-diphosphatase
MCLMIDFLLTLDRSLFLELNGAHAPWLDPVMVLISSRWFWIPFYAFLLWLAYKDFGKNVWVIVIGIAIAVTLADQVTTSFMKPYFERFRPSHDPELQSVVHIIDGYRGSKFGFASSHAANTFALATFFFMLMGKRRRPLVLLFLWAAIVSYSRIYLGVHFPGDIVVGGIVGVIAAWGCATLARFQLSRLGTPSD